MEEKKNNSVGIDLDAFEAQIDQEIDALFVPTMDLGVEDGKAAKAAPTAIESPMKKPETPAPNVAISAQPKAVPAEAPEKNPDESFDFSAFEAKIDSEIDSLFIPVDSSSIPEAKEATVFIPPTEEVAEGKAAKAELTPVEKPVMKPEPPAPNVTQSPQSKTVPADLPEKDPDGSFDFVAFEAKIDSEIDSLFIPVDASPIPEAKETTVFIPPGLAAAKEKDAKAAPTAVESSAMKPRASDADGIQWPQQKVVAPAPPPKSPDHNFEFSISEGKAKEEMETVFNPPDSPLVTKAEESPVVPPAEEVIDRKTLPFIETLKLERMVRQHAASYHPQADQPKADFVQEPQQEKEDELAMLLEDMSIAYLSLDWEFSTENVTKLEAALGRLAPYCRKLHETNALFKVFKAVLNNLRTNPESVDRRLIDFVRDAQALLKLLLLSDGKPGAYERDHLKILINRLRTMRKTIEEVEEVPHTDEPAETPQPVEVLEEQASILPSPLSPIEITTISDQEPLGELRAWMETFNVNTDDTLKRIGLEIKRLVQLETALAKHRALAPVTSRIEKIRASLETELSSFKDMERQWNDRIRWVQNLETGIEQQEAIPLSDTIATPVEPVPDLHRLEEEETPADVPSPAATTKRTEDVYLFKAKEKFLAIPACNVVKLDRVTGKKLEKILNRGYCTLLDFKPLFKSIKAGVLGNWNNLPVDTLKAYRFNLILHNLLGDPVTQAGLDGVTLVSNGRNHGMIAFEQIGANLRPAAEITVDESLPPGVLGTIEGDGGLSIEVIDIEKVLA